MAVLPHEGVYPVMYGSFGVPVGSGYRRGYLARPDRAGRFPTVIVVPGVTGVTAADKNLCRRLARRGLAALALEFYVRHPGSDEEALAAYQALADDDAVHDLDEAYQFLCSDDMTWSAQERVGLLGLDVGGRFALVEAANRSWVGAVAVAYAPLAGDEERSFRVADVLEHLAVPVLGLYGAEDALVAADTVDEAQRRNPAGSWLLYQGVGHGFLDEGADGYDQAAAEDALVRLIGFFEPALPSPRLEELG